jgi:light-regulated signal transduction histidine kinase (bacteriophytochrome)
MGALIDDLLNLSRVTRQEMRREVVDLSKLAGEITAGLREREPDRRVNPIVGPGLTAIGDPGLLRIALANLLDNAFKFSRGSDPATIEFAARHEGEETVYFVRDNGAGFDPTYAHKLFGVFQRLHSADQFEGTSIGLATVQRIVVRHGGTVWAEGDPQQGATFYFTLGTDRRDDNEQE